MMAIVIGLVFMFLGVWGLVAWWGDFILVIRGLVPALVMCGGFLAVIAGVSSLKESSDAKALKEAEEKKV